MQPVSVYPYGIARNRLNRAARRMQVPMNMVDNLSQARVLITTKGFYRKRPRLIVDAERRGLPIYVLRANTVAQMEAALTDIFELDEKTTDRLEEALEEAQSAIEQIQEGVAEVELSPQSAYIRRRQHEMAREADLESTSRGKEPHRRVRIYKE
jgi:hypothetical protein